MNVAVFIKKIAQRDNHSFTIEWSDTSIQNFRLDELQKNCPCAACNQDGKKPNLHNVQQDVKAKRLTSVGPYAIRIEFTSGCSYGIYDYPLLRKIGCLA